MGCYDPTTCITYSNCTSVERCEAFQHHLDITDTIVFNEFLQKRCYIFTCCDSVMCLPTVIPPSPPPINIDLVHLDDSEQNGSVLNLNNIGIQISLGIILILLIIIFSTITVVIMRKMCVKNQI